MKKLLLMSVLLFSSVGVIFASGGGEGTEKGGSEESYTLKLGVVTPTEHPHSISARKFAEFVETKTNGTSF